jgi:hypothetical protein
MDQTKGAILGNIEELLKNVKQIQQREEKIEPTTKILYHLKPVQKTLKIGPMGGLYYINQNGKKTYIRSSRKKKWIAGKNFEKSGCEFNNLSKEQQQVLKKSYKERWKYILPPKK